MEVIGSGKRRDLIAMISLEVGWLLNSSRRPYKRNTINNRLRGFLWKIIKKFIIKFMMNLNVRILRSIRGRSI